MQTIRATEKLQPGRQIVCKLCSMATSIYSTVNLLYKHQFPKITKVKQPKSAAGTWMGDRSSADVGAVKTGNTVVLTSGEPMGEPGGTNTLKIIHVK